MRGCITRFALPLALGLFSLTASPVSAAVELPGGSKIETVDFERHVMGVLGRTGCASGSCHGSFQGKGNFRLSLFGYDPAKDHFALTRDGNGRRLDPSDPDQSLMLLKATGQSEHGGQTRFGKSSWQYQLLRAWIAQGAKWTPGSGQVKSVTITPAEYAFRKYLFLRGGYNVNYDSEGIAGGVGFHFPVSVAGMADMDYAYTDMKDLGSAHRFSLRFQF